MARKGKHSRQGYRYRLRNLSSQHPDYPALVEESQKHAFLSAHQIAAGIYQHPQSGVYQLWISFDGYDCNWLCAQADINQAHQDLSILIESAKSGQLSTGNPGDSAAIFERIEQGSTRKPLNLSPSDLLVIIGRIRYALSTGQSTPEATILAI